MPRFPSVTARSAAVAALLVPLLGACATTEVKVWNLEQLHDGQTHHRYQAALSSDAGWLFRHQFLGIFSGTGAQWASEADVENVEDPSGECLETLADLEERAAADGEPDPRHVEWFTRIAVEDPARLSRERGVLALAALAARLPMPVGLPSRLGADQVPAGPEQLAPVLEDLVRSVRLLSEEKKGAAEAVAASCAAVRALDLDLAAGRRALRASTELQRLAESADVESDALTELVRHLESLCVRRALAAALDDPDDLVRAAAIRGVAATGGARAFDVVLYDRLLKELASRPLRAVLEVLAEHGLPKAGANGAAATHDTEEWLKAIQVVATQHPEGDLRVCAMRTLQRLAAPEVKSLREEDWHAWWIARKAAHKPAGPTP